MQSISSARYCLVYVLSAVAIACVGWMLAAYAQIALPVSLNAIIPPMIASMDQGQRFAKQTKTPLVGTAAWSAAAWMTALVVVMNVVFLALISLAAPQQVALLAQIPLYLIAILIGILLVGVFLSHRIFVSLGSRSQLKTMNLDAPE